MFDLGLVWLTWTPMAEGSAIYCRPRCEARWLARQGETFGMTGVRVDDRGGLHGSQSCTAKPDCLLGKLKPLIWHDISGGRRIPKPSFQEIVMSRCTRDNVAPALPNPLASSAKLKPFACPAVILTAGMW